MTDQVEIQKGWDWFFKIKMMKKIEMIIYFWFSRKYAVYINIR